MGYSILTYQQLEREIIQAIEEANKSIAFPQRYYKNVYDRLFEGFDAGLLNLFCIQVNWSLQGCSTDRLMIALLAYAEKIIIMFPVLNDRIKLISRTSATLSKKFENVSKAFLNDKDCTPICNEIKHMLATLVGDGKTDKMLLTYFNDIANFIDSTLIPAYKDKKSWKDPGLEQCLTNDKFMEGTSASLRNLGLLFRFIYNNIDQSNTIIQGIKGDDSDIIAFKLDGQRGIWALNANVSSKIAKEVDYFSYIKPPHF